MHIASNMIGLIAFSNAVEGFIGKFKYFIFYLLCGIGGNVATLFFGQSYTLSVGASGALWGMMGFFLFLAIFKRKYLSRGFSQTIFSLIALNAIVTFVVPNIDKTAHFGGLITGIVLSFFLLPTVNKKLRG
jgi:membrane associated rhomboid family serine protease